MFKYKKLFLLTITFLTIFVSLTCIAAEKLKNFLNIEEYKSGLSIRIHEEKQIDINNDGKKDFLIYTTGGEEIYLDILIQDKKEHFLLLNTPVAQEYRVLEASGFNELRFGFGTFPNFGNIRGSDKYLWFDFYVVEGFSLKLNNRKHVLFYQKILLLYEKRIQELDTEIVTLKKQNNIDGINDILIQIKKDHIARYKKFILKGLAIVKNKGL